MRRSFFSATEERSSKRLSVFQTKTFLTLCFIFFFVWKTPLAFLEEIQHKKGRLVGREIEIKN
jgi:hypothetical protein